MQRDAGKAGRLQRMPWRQSGGDCLHVNNMELADAHHDNAVAVQERVGPWIKGGVPSCLMVWFGWACAFLLQRQL